MEEKHDSIRTDEHKKTYESMWKSDIIFGLICIGLVLLCTKLPVRILSVGLILILLGGVVISAQNIKESWKAGLHGQALLGCIGFSLHIAAVVLYVIGIFQGMLMKI